MPLPSPSRLDFGQVLQYAFDDTTYRLRTDANVTATIAGPVEVLISHTDDSIRLGDGTSLVTATTVGPDVGLDVNIIGGVVSGTFSPTGLYNGLKASVMTITDVPQTVPLVAFTDRNTMSVRVWGTNTIYFGHSSINSSNGYPKLQFEELFVDVTDAAAVNLYAVCAPGQTSELRIIEVA